MKLYKLKPGDNRIRILPPEGQMFDYPHYDLVPRMSWEEYEAYIKRDLDCVICRILLEEEFRSNGKDVVNAYKEAAD